MGRSAPLPRLPGGGPHFSREMGRKRAGASPLDPGVHGRSFPLAGFWVGCLWCVRGAISSGMLKPIWDAFSGKNMLESILIGPVIAPQPPCYAPTSKAFPLGGRWPGEAGSDEGATLYATFPRRKETLYRPSPQRGFSIAPLGNPVAPSSVTFGDSFPPRGSLWVVQPYPKKRPKSGHVHGHRNSPTTAPLRYPTPKPASGNERALKKGVQGARPPALFPPAFSGESRAPARSRAGNHAAGLDLRRSQRNPLPTAARQSRSRLPPNQKGRPQGLPFSPIPCYALVTVFRMPLPAVSLGLVSKPSFS